MVVWGLPNETVYCFLFAIVCNIVYVRLSFHIIMWKC